MVLESNPNASAADREIVITRTFDAPPELVWRAWTDPQQVVLWWGPTGFTTTTHSMDVRVGGEWRFDMHGPDGVTYPNRIIFEEVDAPNRLVYSHRDAGAVEPVSFQSIVNFERQGGQTKLTMRMIFPSASDRERIVREYGAVDGALQHVERLAMHVAEQKSLRSSNTLTIALPSEREIVMVRSFDASRQLVWDANTQADLLKRWLMGPPGWSWLDCENDVRVGGRFRWSWVGPDDAKLIMSGEYREIVPIERIVRTETFEVGCEAQAGEQLATLELTESSGRTILKCIVLYPSMEARDGAIASGMEHGVAACYARLDEMFASCVS